MHIPQPSTEQRRLEAFVGNFASRETIHPNEHMPQGGVAETITVGRLACNGFAVAMDYSQKVGNQVVYAGHGLFRHNPAEHVYELDWFDSMAPNGTHFRGDFTGNVLVFTAKLPNPMRLLYDFNLKGGFRFRMEVSDDGSNWKPMLDGDNVKVSMKTKYAKKKKKTTAKKKKAAAKKKAGRKKAVRKKVPARKKTTKRKIRKKTTKKRAAKKKTTRRKKRR